MSLKTPGGATIAHVLNTLNPNLGGVVPGYVILGLEDVD